MRSTESTRKPLQLGRNSRNPHLQPPKCRDVLLIRRSRRALHRPKDGAQAVTQGPQTTKVRGYRATFIQASPGGSTQRSSAIELVEPAKGSAFNNSLARACSRCTTWISSDTACAILN